MERIKRLARYQKGILLFMIGMVSVFTVIYAITTSRVGFAYKDTILVAKEENGCTVYSGEIKGKQAVFTVSEEKTVTFQYGEKTYGPYTAKEDPTAIPKEEEMTAFLTGVELRRGEDILFRGGFMNQGEYPLLFHEDGTVESDISIFGDDFVELDENGNAIDPMEPSVCNILSLMEGPELTHKGDWLAWFGAVLVCIFNAITILFANELFRWDLSFQIRNADLAEPSDWELAKRAISWILLLVIAFSLWMMGLQ